MSDEYSVPIGSGDIFWNLVPIARETKRDGVLVELQWGWTAGMSEEDMKDYADDAPKGYNSVVTNLEMAKILRDNLDKIISKYEKKKEVNEHEPFGYFLALDLYGVSAVICDSLEMNYRFLEELVHFLGMTPMAPPTVIHAPSKFDENGVKSEVYPDKAGISAWQPLIESGIQIHTIAPKEFLSIDIFTCGDLDIDKTIEFVSKFYGCTKCDHYHIKRGHEYHGK